VERSLGWSSRKNSVVQLRLDTCWIGRKASECQVPINEFIGKSLSYPQKGPDQASSAEQKYHVFITF
jgi:hypothetical protein